MPKMITLQNQKNYFYVPDLLKNKIIKENFISQNQYSNDFIDLYEQFSFKTKYIKLLGNKENLDNGIDKINQKITYKIGTHLLFPESMSLKFILLFINDNIGIKIDFKR